VIKFRHISAALAIAGMLLSACDLFQIPTPAPTQATPDSTSTVAPTDQPGATPTPAETLAATPPPTPTASPTPSPTPSPSPTPTPLPTPTPTAAAGWSTPALADPVYAEYVSALVDAAGHTHIVASDLHSVYYVTDAGGSWVRTQVAQAPAGGADIEPVIASSPDGGLAVAFTRWSVFPGFAGNTLGEIEGVYFTRLGESGWSEPSQVPGFGQHPVLAFWSDSWNVLAEQRDGLFWYRKDGFDWPGRQIGDRGAQDAQLAVDGEGVAHVVFVTSKNLVHVTRNGKLADAAIPASGGAGNPHLATNAAGQVELVYVGGVGQVLHRTFDGQDWSNAEQLDVNGVDAFAIDASGNQHFVHLTKAEAADVVYQSIAAGSVNTVHIAPVQALPGGLQGLPAMAVDALGRPHVVFSTAGIGAGVYVSVGPAL
jgi:hypothetical protein